MFAPVEGTGIPRGMVEVHNFLANRRLRCAGIPGSVVHVHLLPRPKGPYPPACYVDLGQTSLLIPCSGLRKASVRSDVDVGVAGGKVRERG